MNIDDIIVDSVEKVTVEVNTNDGLYDVEIMPFKKDYLKSATTISTRCNKNQSKDVTIEMSCMEKLLVKKHKDDNVDKKFDSIQMLFNFKELNEKLQDFESRMGRIPNIYMSSRTYQSIKCAIMPSSPDKTVFVQEDMLTYRGSTVYKDDKLSYGIVELR